MCCVICAHRTGDDGYEIGSAEAPGEYAPQGGALGLRSEVSAAGVCCPDAMAQGSINACWSTRRLKPIPTRRLRSWSSGGTPEGGCDVRPPWPFTGTGVPRGRVDRPGSGGRIGGLAGAGGSGGVSGRAAADSPFPSPALPCNATGTPPLPPSHQYPRYPVNLPCGGVRHRPRRAHGMPGTLAPVCRGKEQVPAL